MREMACYSIGEILGIHTNRGVLCADCCSDEEWNTMEEDEIITQQDLEGDFIYFCDECKMRIC